ncbi:MAG: CPBP family intramembrane metalloprotease [Bacteroidetes bacterium]|nr:MAG: CPBP family intramembrane metalloprotease [Bacteroidota bacterium]
MDQVINLQDLREEVNYALIWGTLGFLAFWFTGQSPQLLRYFINRFGQHAGQAAQVYLKRLVGIIGFGLLPGIILVSDAEMDWADYGVVPHITPVEWYWMAGLGALVIFMTSRSTRQADNLRQYPEIRQLPWNTRLLVWSALSWVGYLIAYELYFRGFLLFSCTRAFNPATAVVVNTVIYSLVHVPKGAKEGIGAIPLGILLCYITLDTGSIIVPVVVHIILALSNEWFSLKYRLEATTTLDKQQ